MCASPRSSTISSSSSHFSSCASRAVSWFGSASTALAVLGGDRTTGALRGVGGLVLGLFERALRRLCLRRSRDRGGRGALRGRERIGSSAGGLRLRLRRLVEE